MHKYEALATPIYLNKIRSLVSAQSYLFPHVIAASDSLQLTHISKLLRKIKSVDQPARRQVTGSWLDQLLLKCICTSCFESPE